MDVAMHEIERIAAKGIEREAPAAQSAITVLRIFAFLDHANIPEELFKNAAENYMERNLDEEAENGLPLSVKLLDHKTLFLSKEGRWDEAEKMHLDVMNTRKTKLGLDHPDTLAEKMHLEVMNTRKTKLGLDHPDTLVCMHDLANTYSNQGRWDEAEKMHLDVMNTRKTKLGLDHPDTLGA
ncbi:hypothetical protein F5887DRAFT_1090554 [Amanita rubescens]|nr:hypothetical protein F5887DRAFT_1090554 [Amanita rubescens]